MKSKLDVQKKKGTENKGITLVALVITIIVLLILAGVSINLVAGSNGILGKATKAVDVNNMAKIKEEIELKIAELQMDYYMKDNNFANINDYVKAELEKGVELPNGAEISCDSNGNLSYEGVEIGTLNPNGSVTIDGELSGSQIVTKYTVSYNANGGQGGPANKKYATGENVTIDFATKPTKKGANFLGWARTQNATTPEYTNSGSFTMGNQSVTLYAVWETLAGTAAIMPEYYGDKVNYSANGVSDWQVFLNDGSNVYLISSNYVPNSGMSLETGIEKVEGSDYRVYTSNPTQLFNWLTNPTNWSAYATGVTGATAMGGATKPQFTDSYNAKYGTNHSTGLDTTSDGYTIENNVEPYKTEGKENCASYWLASMPSDKQIDVWCIYNTGLVTAVNYAAYGIYRGIRPLVKLPVNAKMNWSGTAWILEN